MQTLILAAAKLNVTDLHCSPERVPMVRIGGVMRPMGSESITQSMLLEWIASITDLATLRQTYAADGAFSLETLRIRYHCFCNREGTSMVFRLLPMEALSMESLGLPASIRQLTTYQAGLVIITGPTGSGKSSTLAALVSFWNTHEARHIITLEDPIEYIHMSNKSLIQQREIGVHVATFQAGLLNALRADPDVILIGEMRSKETIQLALTAAETGHLVLCTLHTHSAPGAIGRIVDLFHGDEQSLVRTTLSETLQAIVAQRLVSDNSGKLKLQTELLLGIPAVRHLIRDDKVHLLYSVIETNRSIGMHAFAD
jgi:twitching motility protein PilT